MKNKVVKAGVWYTICNFLVKGLVFITMPIFTRIMTGEEIGLYSNISSWVTLLAIVTTSEIYSSVSVARFDYKDDLDSYISSSLLLGTCITVVFYIIVLIFHQLFEKVLNMDFFTINLVFVYLMCYPAMQMFLIKNQINYNYKSTIVVSLISSFLSTFFSILFTVYFIGGLRGRIVGYFVPLIICNFVLYILLIKKGKSISTKYWKYALLISFPLIWHLLAGYILNSSDRIMITSLISAEANALYSVPYMLSMVVSLLWSSMNNAWSPWAYEKMDKKEYNELFSKSKPYTIFFLVIVMLFILVGPELLFIMGGKNYLQAKYIIPPVMIGYTFQFIYSLYVNIEFYHKKQFNIAISTMTAAIINIILNFLLLKKFGYIIAAYTTLIGYIVLLFMHYLSVRKLNCEGWYDTKFFVKICLLSLCSIPVFILLYKYNVIRYIFIGLLFITAVVFILKNKKSIVDMIKNKSVFYVFNQKWHRRVK